MIAKCQNCQREHDLGQRVGWKLGMASAGAGICHRADLHWTLKIFGGFVGLGVGYYLDRNVLPDCPACGGVLRVLDTLL